MEFEKPRVSRVAQQVFDSYRTRLATAVTSHGYTTSKIANDSELKPFIDNFVQENIIERKSKDALVGISHRFAHMEVSGNDQYNGLYPIVHKYVGHNLMGSYVFYKDDDGTCHVDFISLEAPAIIVP